MMDDGIQLEEGIRREVVAMLLKLTGRTDLMKAPEIEHGTGDGAPEWELDQAEVARAAGDQLLGGANVAVAMALAVWDSRAIGNVDMQLRFMVPRWQMVLGGLIQALGARAWEEVEDDCCLRRWMSDCEGWLPAIRIAEEAAIRAR